ncbi:MAG: phosphoserine phosphatase SerB [Robiginitomaculum sp.]
MTATNIQSLTTIVVLPVRDARAFAAAEGLCFGPSADLDGYRVLAQGRAFEFTSKGSDQNALRARLSGAGISADICVMPSAGRKKRLLICDMDSTLIGQECIDELADFAGVKAYVSEITERAMRGELDFEAALKERVGLLKGLPLENLQKCYDERIALNPGARTLARTMAKHGAKTVIVSGGFTFFSSRIAANAGFRVHQANVLLDDGAALTGAVSMPILGREAKAEALRHHSETLGGASAAIAIGDGANDLAMINAAGLGIAYYAKPAVAAAAHCAIEHTDLTTALFYQGYSEDEFAQG